MGRLFSLEGILISCEHGGNRIPAPYAHLFRNHGSLLRSHRAYDEGAADLARYLGRALGAPCFVADTSRLLVDLNRSPGNRNLFSAVTRTLGRMERERILDEYYEPHRQAVESVVSTAVTGGLRVVHVAVHSFVPVLDGIERTCDVSLLYDPARREEFRLCAGWIARMRAAVTGLRLRRNYPYRGVTDGFCTYLRKRFPANRYIGVELELNQALLRRNSGSVYRIIRKKIAATLAAALEDA